MKNRLMFARAYEQEQGQIELRDWQEGNEFASRRTTKKIHMVMDLFCILTALVSISWLWYRFIVFQNVAIGMNQLKLTTAFESKIISKLKKKRPN